MKKGILIIATVLLAGCGSSLKTSWNNFRAHYNTFYNAKKDFRAGLSKVNNQPIQIDPEQLVRVHPVPAAVGREDFANAIAKGADILRRFPETKWTDDALLLIGKSYYYRQEYFLAIRKFEELLDYPRKTTLKQEAVIWKGRALLEVSAYGEGVSFLETELSTYKGTWKTKDKAEVRIVLAEHLGQEQNWQQATDTLKTAIQTMKASPFQGRAYFLLGQLYERLHQSQKAFQAYNNVASFFPDYEYIYWAGIKKAEAQRQLGNSSFAADIYTAMLKDDKNFKRRNEIYYQLARTLVQQGKYGRAEKMYKNILKNPGEGDGANLRSDTYYHLGQLYGSKLNDYKMAAAYYDSASTQLSQAVSNTKDTDALADAYNKYVTLKAKASRADSLLRLGRLSRSELDSVLVEVRRQKRIELQQNRQLNQQSQHTLVNVSRDQEAGDTEQADASGFGFLDYRNSQSVAKQELQFRAIWGNRPLVDNWRESDAIASNSGTDQPEQIETTEPSIQAKSSQTDKQLGIDLGAIPFSAEAQKQKKEELYNVQYQLGNLFFLNLNRPDSAAVYYKKVIRQSASEALVSRALYSLYQLYDLQQMPDSAAVYRKRILDGYPHSIYARRIKEPEKEYEQYTATADSMAVLQDEVQQIMQADSAESPAWKARKLRELALRHQRSALAPAIYYQAIQAYIKIAKTSPPVPPDSLTGPVPDSLIAPPSENPPGGLYEGRAWDHVRALIKEYQKLFPQSAQIKIINGWAKVLNKEDRLLTCQSLGVQPKVKPDMAAFLKTVELPEKLKRMKLSGTLSYKIMINKDGSVASFERLSKATNLGIEEAYERAFRKDLQFFPVMQDSMPVKASCKVDFPIQK